MDSSKFFRKQRGKKALKEQKIEGIPSVELRTSGLSTGRTYGIQLPTKKGIWWLTGQDFHGMGSTRSQDVQPTTHTAFPYFSGAWNSMKHLFLKTILDHLG